MNLSLTIVLVAYFAAVIALAAVGYRRTRTSADFIVAGRSLGALVGGATLAATQISAGTFVGTVGLHYMAGVCFVWVWPGAWLGWLVSAVFVAPPAVKLPAVPRLEAAALVADAGPVVRPFVRTALLRERNKVRAMLRQARREVEF